MREYDCKDCGHHFGHDGSRGQLPTRCESCKKKHAYNKMKEYLLHKTIEEQHENQF